MNRPDRKDYYSFDETVQRDTFLQCKYDDDLNAYCDYLEKELKDLKVKTLHELMASENTVIALEGDYAITRKALEIAAESVSDENET